MVGIVLAAAIMRRVGDQPARGGVALGGDLVAGRPELAYGGQGAPPLGLVDAGGTPPRVLSRRRDVVDQVLELLLGPVRPCPTRPAPRRSRRAARPAPRRRGRRTPARAAAAAVATSRPRSAPCASNGPGSPRPAWPGRRGGSRAVGPRARCRTGAVGTSPTSRRHGRSWLAACRIHSASPIASFSEDRSSKAVGSISAVPDPSRRSWIR